MKSIYLCVIVQFVMRTMAVLTILSWGNMKAIAQEWDHEYVPFVEEGKVWNCNNTDYADLGIVDFVFTMRGDTLIGENIYKKVFCQYEKYYGDDEHHYYCAVRENEYHVYLVEPETKEEKLIYDFSHPKDTLILSNYDHKVARMAGTRMDYWPSKQLIFNVFGISGDEIRYQYFVDVWIEGVGSWGSNPFAAKTTSPKPDPIFGSYYVVVSCIIDEKCLFDYDWMVIPSSVQETEKSIPKGSIYDLSGRKVQGKPQKGVYIQNGKKVVIK